MIIKKVGTKINEIYDNLKKNIKWIDLKNFFVVYKNKIFFFRIFIKKKNLLKKIKYRIVNFLSTIMYAIFQRKKKLLIYSTLEGNLHYRDFLGPTFFLNFFLNFYVILFKQDFYLQKIVYIVVKKKIENFLKRSEKNFSLIILNLEEGKFINLFNFQNLFTDRRPFCVVDKNRTIIIGNNKNINFFNLNWTTKKIKKFKIKHNSEICFLNYYANLLIISDINGNIFLLEHLIGKKPTPNRVNFLVKNDFSFLILKKKIKFSNILIFELGFFRNKTIFVNLFGDFKITNFDLVTKKKNTLVFFDSDKKRVIFSLKVSQNKNILIDTIDGLLFLIHKKKSFCFLKIKKIFFSLVYSENSWLDHENYVDAILSSQLFLPGYFFIVLKISNAFLFLNFKKNVLTEKKAVNVVNLSDGNLINFSIGKQKLTRNFFYFFNYFCIIKIPVNPIFFQKKGDFLIRVSEQSEASKKKKNIGKIYWAGNGRKLAFSRIDGMVKIWNGSPFNSNSIDSHKIFRFSRKTNSAMCISENGLYLAFSFSKTIFFYDISCKFVKADCLTIDFESDICNLVYFSFNNKEYIIINSKTEVSVWDLNNKSIISNNKIKILKILVDKWDSKFLIVTRIFDLESLKINQCMMIFRKTSPVPLLFIDFRNLTNGSVISACFSYFLNKKKFQSILIIDTLMKVHKIFF